jgi:hypothetical protein
MQIMSKFHSHQQLVARLAFQSLQRFPHIYPVLEYKSGLYEAAVVTYARALLRFL